MNEEIEARLWLLLLNIEAGLDRIHDEAIAKFDWLARSVGQKLRADRALSMANEDRKRIVEVSGAVFDFQRGTGK